MTETAAQGIISPVLSDSLLFLNIALNVILLFAFAYLWTTRHQTGEISQLKDKVKKLSNDLKLLEERFQELKTPKKVETVPEPEPFGFNFNKKKEAAAPPAPKIPSGSQVWSKFVNDFNYIAASMMVPGQEKACQKFVDENDLSTIKFGFTGNFLPAVTVGDSNLWAWKMPDAKSYAVVPNPLKPCTGELYEESGMKSIFAMNFQNGIYKKYIVKAPAIFTVDERNHWALKDPGVAELERQ